jgi:hypothetical protein
MSDLNIKEIIENLIDTFFMQVKFQLNLEKKLN